MRFDGAVGEVGVAGVGHVLREVEEGLLRVVEVGRDDELAGEVEAEAFGDVFEGRAAVRAGDGEGGGGEDDARVSFEERLGEELGDVDGGGLEVGVERLVRQG